MPNLIFSCLGVLHRKWVKWPLLIGGTLLIAAAHVVMYLKYGGTEKAPSLQLTLVVHGLLLLAAGVAIVFYYKFLKERLTEYEQEKCTNN